MFKYKLFKLFSLALLLLLGYFYFRNQIDKPAVDFSGIWRESAYGSIDRTDPSHVPAFFTLKLTQIGNTVDGHYCALGMIGGKDACPNDSVVSINGTVKKNIAYVNFTDDQASGNNGMAEITLSEDNVLNWKVAKPSNEFSAIPTESKLSNRYDLVALIGIWQADSPTMGSGWGDRYHFFSDGTYYFISSGMNCSSRDVEHTGRWDLEDGNIILVEQSVASKVGGKLVKSDGSCGTPTKLVDYKFEQKAVIPNKVANLKLEFKNSSEDTYNKPYIKIDKRDFYQFETDPKIDLTEIKPCTEKQEGKAVIVSIFKSTNYIGDTLEVEGCNFTGFEGDINAWIENSDGLKGILYGEEGSTSQVFKSTLPSKICTTDNSYSGLACTSYLELKSGDYKLWLQPWGDDTKSNEINIKII